MSVHGITDTMQYLTFKLGEETFALEVAKVREYLTSRRSRKYPRPPSS